MERNFETVMIEQCAPVLASLKPAGLFRYETSDCADLARRVRSWNEQLGEKGLCVRAVIRHFRKLHMRVPPCGFFLLYTGIPLLVYPPGEYIRSSMCYSGIGGKRMPHEARKRFGAHAHKIRPCNGSGPWYNILYIFNPAGYGRGSR